MNPLQAYQQMEDRELLNRYRQNHDKDCLGILLQRYTLLLLGVCMKYLKDEEEAKDAVQQVFSKALTEVDKYQIDHFKSWIYTVARNHCFMQLRHKTHSLPEEAIEKNNNLLFSENSTDTLSRIKEKEHLLEMVEEALQWLQPNQKECVSLFYLEQKSYRQISDATGFSLLQIKSFIQNGKRNIRMVIEKKLKENAS